MLYTGGAIALPSKEMHFISILEKSDYLQMGVLTDFKIAKIKDKMIISSSVKDEELTDLSYITDENEKCYSCLGKQVVSDLLS